MPMHAVINASCAVKHPAVSRERLDTSLVKVDVIGDEANLQPGSGCHRSTTGMSPTDEDTPRLDLFTYVFQCVPVPASIKD